MGCAQQVPSSEYHKSHSSRARVKNSEREGDCATRGAFPQPSGVSDKYSSSSYRLPSKNVFAFIIVGLGRLPQRNPTSGILGIGLWARILHSCLVPAGRWCEPGREGTKRGGYLALFVLGDEGCWNRLSSLCLGDRLRNVCWAVRMPKTGVFVKASLQAV